ncbi:hypothetical protein R3P38DRAFT_2841206 [Favolaschia claudopus]|uniref:Uncharacterized protein n=1 Tax=Favolaschia claudopus TaxID=2862362 RepID=A0AAW0E391_9AGAR
MPTATTTITSTASPTTMKLKSTAGASSGSAKTTLNTLYHRAARAFLLREVAVVQSLLDSASALLPAADVALRTKWDVLRITLETTVYAAPPPPASLPPALAELLTQPPAALIDASYRRSLALFATPHIPSAVALTLVYASLKLDAPDAGRVIIEDWLASRNSSDTFEAGDAENYRKAVETYCLHVLPKLEQWEYASEFLDYESELPADVRESMKLSLRTLHAQSVAARLPPPSPVSPSPPPRSYSPTPSSSSSSSLSSTASAHTIVPPTPRPRPRTNPSSSSSASTATATPRRTTPSQSLPISHPIQRSPLPRLRPPASTATPTSTYTLLRAALSPYLSSKTNLAAAAISFATFVLLLLWPLLVRRRRLRTLQTVDHADAVRRRLAAASAANTSAGMLSRVVAAVIRVVGDTIRMGGSGLV